ncbi:2-hydroxyacyl-CoA lyase [Haematococcus lacustris]
MPILVLLSTSGSGDGKRHESISPAPVAGVGDGYELTARALAALGVTEAYGVIGIPVTPLASSLQAAGIRFIAFRNEQAAGYAAASAGFLAGRPPVLLTVSGPGAIHGIAGLSHAKTNCWPLIMIAGSCEQDDVGKGGFQEVDQVAALTPYCKYAVQAGGLAAIPSCLAAAVRQATSGRPGACYVDIPSNVFMRQADPALLRDLPALTQPGQGWEGGRLACVAQLLRGAQRPLMVVGKGAALGRAEEAVKQLAEQCDLPVLTTSMGRGVLPDQHPLCVNAARSSALKGADLVLVVGARLNWQLHFGEAPRWSGSVRFVLVDPAPSDRDAALAACCLKAPAAQALHQLAAVARQGAGAATGPANVGGERARDPTWVKALQGKAEQATRRLAARISAAPHSPLEYFGVMGALDAALAPLLPAPVLVSEGANTMDMARLIITAKAPRTRLDAGTWGTMGVGLGGAIAAATVTCSPAPALSDQAGAGRNSTGVPPRLVVAVEGDSAFGFSGMECETMVRYRLPILVVVMNNGGIYGGDRRTAELQGAAATGAHQAGFAADPIPTAFAPTRYNDLMASFGGMGLRATSLPELRERLGQGIAHCLSGQGPALLDVVLDPMAGVESGNVHAFNAPQSKL